MFPFNKLPSTLHVFDRFARQPGQRVREDHPRLEVLEDRTAPTAGLLDPTFGVRGKVISDWRAEDFDPEHPEHPDDQAYAMAVQSDGKILVAGSTLRSGAAEWSDFVLARYTSSGALDVSFGDGGRVITDFQFGYDVASSVVVQPDGKILVAGITWQSHLTGYDFALVRYTSSGELDLTFSDDGKVVTDFNEGADWAHGIALQADGKILICGSTRALDGDGTDFAVARYAINGELDTSFGGTGKVITEFKAGESDASSLVVQPDGRIIVGGSVFARSGGGARFALVRYTTVGKLDPSFGTGGKVMSDFAGTEEWISAVVVRPTGKIVVAGSITSGKALGYNYVVAQYSGAGKLDASFGKQGKVVTDFAGGHDLAAGLALQRDGKIVIAGSTWKAGGTGSNYAVARYHPTGQLDFTFGAHGKVVTDFGGGDDLASAVLVQPDGKILVAGSTWTAGGTGWDFAVARYLVRFSASEFRPPVVYSANSTFVYAWTPNQFLVMPATQWAYSPDQLPLRYELVGKVPAGLQLSSDRKQVIYLRPSTVVGTVLFRFRITDALHATRILTVVLRGR